ncbi:MAG: PhoPQ-activated pathogenicity-related family protein [Aeoliella sp.]
MTNRFVLLVAVACITGLNGGVATADEGAAVADATAGVERALADFLAKEDSSYRWVKVRDGKIDSSEFAELILTSQTWKETVWKHRLFLILPASAKEAKQGVLVIAGGDWNEKYADPDYDEALPGEARLFAQIAEQLKSPVAVLLNVPQQPMFDGLVEDEIISLTLDKYFQTSDSDWPLLLPMVKSAVRGMDATQEFCQKEWSLSIESFTVTGASKRGWTTWLVGATDERVTAIAPMVIDTLNMNAQMQHQIDAWGAFSEEIQDYTDRDIQKRMNTPIGKSLQQIIDPFAYREFLTQPKLIIIGTNDHYWPLDALNLYWEELEGPKYILYVPNNQHGLRDFPRLLGSLAAVHAQARGSTPLPKLEWSFEEGKSVTLRIESDRPPKKVQVWLANSDSRDFRQSSWSPHEAQRSDDAFIYHLDTPVSGYAAIFGEAVYEEGGAPFYLSTNVRIVSSAEIAETKE